MNRSFDNVLGPSRACSRCARALTAAGVLLLCLLSGCAAMTNPVSSGIPASQVPLEILGEPREEKETIPLTLLRQRPPKVYRLGPGDVLGVYIEGVLGDRSQAPPVNFPQVANLPPALGYPIPVREDGTLPMPLINPVPVADLTIDEAQAAIIRAYTVDRVIVQPGRERIIVTLIRPRQTRILVIRQDSPSGGLEVRTVGGILSTRGILGRAEALEGGSRRGTGTIVDLPAYENDVLHALAHTGGLPGLDANNEVIIQRGYFGEAPDREDALRQLHGPSSGARPEPAGGFGGQTVRIPLRMRPGEPLPFRPEDVILYDGDIVFIEARHTEVFYTGGLLPAGEFPLPRDYDLDVVEAVCAVNGPLVNGGSGVNNLSGSIVSPGIGTPSPSLLTVLRRTPGGGQIPIRVDLNRALQDPRESILVQPGDVLILQETPGEAVARYASDVFLFRFVTELFKTSSSVGSATAVVP